MTRRSFGVALVVALVVSSCTSDEDDVASTASTEPSETLEVMTEPEPDFDDVAGVPPGAEGETTGPLGSTEIRIDTDAGTVQIGAGQVPEGLDPLFPIPQDFEVQLASETAEDLGFSGTTSATFDELIALFEDGLPAAGYVIVSFDRREGFGQFEFADDRATGQVAITSTPSVPGFTLIVTFGAGSE